jgi:hypothetical protein
MFPAPARVEAMGAASGLGLVQAASGPASWIESGQGVADVPSPVAPKFSTAALEGESPAALPLVLPGPAGMLPFDLPAWEQRVRAFFDLLDTAVEEAPEGIVERLVPWLATVGVMAGALELARRHRGRRPPLPVTAGVGRGWSWPWPPEPLDPKPQDAP